ncbi:DUF6510 family protein [Geodermatophilus sp. URMC 60]
MTDPSRTVDPTSVRRLDGNAAAGSLADLFAVDLTVATSRCASCGTTSVLGAHHLYADAPAMVLRCPTCTEVVLRFASREGRILLDLRGAGLLTVPVAVTAVDEEPRQGAPHHPAP